MSQTTILVVEDNYIQSQLLICILDKLGFHTEAANCVEAATNILDTKAIDAALVDWNLPDNSGLSLVEARVKDETCTTPFIIMTAYEEPERIKEALACGAFDFVHKPLKSLELDARLNCALRFASLQKKYLELAIRDPLTGTFNRRYLQQQTDLFFSTPKNSLTLALIDIDFFKKVNDTYGHDVGDMGLVQIARLLSSHLRIDDYVCRIGGEEFAIVFHNSNGDIATTIMERILQKARESSWGTRGSDLKVTFSCGVVSSEEANSDLFAMLKSADESLYWAKKHGRNQVVRSQCNLGIKASS